MMTKHPATWLLIDLALLFCLLPSYYLATKLEDARPLRPEIPGDLCGGAQNIIINGEWIGCTNDPGSPANTWIPSKGDRGYGEVQREPKKGSKAFSD